MPEQVTQVTLSRSAKFHTSFLFLTIMTCGLMAPVWAVAALIRYLNNK